MAGSASLYAYISDDGATYSIYMDDSNALAVGNTAGAAFPNLPRGYHPRYVNARHPTSGKERQVVIGDPTNALFIGPGAGSVTLEDFGADPSANTVYTVRSRVGEKRYARG